MRFDPSRQLRVAPWAVIEIGAQCQNDGQRTVRFGTPRDPEVQETTTLLFRDGLCKDFFKLVDEEHTVCVCSFQERDDQQVETTRGVIFQVFTDTGETACGKVLGQDQGELFNGALSWHHRFQVE